MAVVLRSGHASLTGLAAEAPPLRRFGRHVHSARSWQCPRPFSVHGNMPRKTPKLALLADRIANARRIIDAQQKLLLKLKTIGQPTHEAEAALRTYVSSLELHDAGLREAAHSKKGETKKSH